MSTPTNALDFLFKERKPAETTPEPEDGYTSIIDYVQDITGLSEDEIEQVTNRVRDAVMEAEGDTKKILRAVVKLYLDADTEQEQTMIAIEFGRVLAMLASSSKTCIGDAGIVEQSDGGDERKDSRGDEPDIGEQVEPFSHSSFIRVGVNLSGLAPFLVPINVPERWDKREGSAHNHQ